MRLMVRTGPVWDDLSGDTAVLMAETLRKLLLERTAIARIIPWLSRLADPAGPMPPIPADVRETLVEALAAMPPSEDTASRGKISRLAARLAARWGMRPEGSVLEPSVSPMAPLRCSMSNLEKMQARCCWALQSI